MIMVMAKTKPKRKRRKDNLGTEPKKDDDAAPRIFPAPFPSRKRPLPSRGSSTGDARPEGLPGSAASPNDEDGAEIGGNAPVGGETSAKRRKKRRKRQRRAESNANEAPAVDGRTFSLMDCGVDILQGLVMHEKVVSEDFERQLISFVQEQCEWGRRGELRKPTYLRSGGARSHGNRREAIMYGGFFDFNRARPGKRGLVPPFPPILERLVDHLMSRGFLPADVRPDSCIINQYDRGDCIPPHVDHKSYYRPISTLSLLGEESMLLGSKFRTVKPCVWSPIVGRSIPLPRRSLLVLGGNSGDVAKHCISACRGKRISITLRKQPPPDWKPDAEELVRGTAEKKFGRPQSGRDEGKEWKEDIDRPRKKKALSGSAKRRKKMLKMMMARQGGGPGRER